MYLTRLIIASITLQYLHPIITLESKDDDHYLYEYIAAFPYLQLMQDVVWFISEQLDGEQNERTNNLIKNISNFTKLTQFVWTQLSDVRMIKIQSKRNYIGVLVTTGPKDPIMLVHQKHLIGRHYSSSFVVYVGKVKDDDSMEPIRELCYLLYQNNFVNSVVYFKTKQQQSLIYSIQMYPEFKMINSTNYIRAYKELKQRISSASQDVKGYKFYSPLKQDVPNVFIYKDKEGKDMVQGISYAILKTFISSIKGDLKAYEHHTNKTDLTNIINMKQVLELVRYKHIDIAAHAHSLFQPDDEVDKSYPLMVVKWCLMIPLHNSISTFFYILQPFEWKIWCLLLAALAAMCLKDFMDIICKCHRQKNFNTCWLNNLCHIINISPTQNISPNNIPRFLYYALIFSFGFFLSSFYTSFLGSSLTVNLFRDQINSLEDLIKANQSVMIIDYELEFLFAEGYKASPDFQKLLFPVNSSTFYQHQVELNASYAYFITHDRWHFLHESQKHLKQKLFKFSDICFGSYHLAYPMQSDSPIWRDLEYFLFHIHSSGLFQKYERKALYYAFKGGILKRLEKTKTYNAAGWEHLQVVFYFLICMHVISLICLIGEIFYYNCQNERI